MNLLKKNRILIEHIHRLKMEHLFPFPRFAEITLWIATIALRIDCKNESVELQDKIETSLASKGKGIANRPGPIIRS